eukprot:362822-Chlamydomonas_euryale.AAC.39
MAVVSDSDPEHFSSLRVSCVAMQALLVTMAPNAACLKAQLLCACVLRVQIQTRAVGMHELGQLPVTLVLIAPRIVPEPCDSLSVIAPARGTMFQGRLLWHYVPGAGNTRRDGGLITVEGVCRRRLVFDFVNSRLTLSRLRQATPNITIYSYGG